MTMTSKTPSKTFLLVPSMPTPNGKLHLGHIAGPFLRLDAATRYLKSRGHKALLVSGTDPYESYVSHRAEGQGIDPHQLAQKYTQKMQSDLAAFNIDYDILLNPLLYPGREIFERHCYQLLQRLLNRHEVSYKTRAMPYSSTQKQFMPRSFLAGKCPSCQSGIVGSLCEGCGRQFIAEEVIEPHFRPLKAELPADDLAWQQIDILELCLRENDAKSQNIVAAIVADVESLNIPSRHKDIILNHVHNQKGFVELTVPGTYGLPWQSQDDTQQVIFSYSTVYPFFLAIDEILTTALGTGESAFAENSDIVTISTYGADITIPWIAVPTILSHIDVYGDNTDTNVNTDGQRRYCGYDHYWGNEFLCLHGEKFSTSRLHVIWASELIEKTPINADMARFYLATIDPAQQQTNFLIDQLVNTVNHIVIDEIYHTVDTCLQAHASNLVQAPSPNMAKAIAQVFILQDNCFESSQFHLDKAATVISNWIKTWHQLNDKNQSDSYWFAKSLAIISYPIMSTFAQQLWRHLGATGIPNTQAFDNKTVMLSGHFQASVQPISQADISPCLPDTLNHLKNNLTNKESNPPNNK